MRRRGKAMKQNVVGSEDSVFCGRDVLYNGNSRDGHREIVW